jgi:hypothetical protein
VVVVVVAPLGMKRKGVGVGICCWAGWATTGAAGAAAGGAAAGAAAGAGAGAAAAAAVTITVPFIHGCGVHW